MKHLVIVIGLALAGCPGAFAADFYASPDGSGTRCSKAKPCDANYLIHKKELPRGGGHNLLFLPGTYVPTGPLDLTDRHGAPGAWIEISPTWRLDAGERKVYDRVDINCTFDDKLGACLQFGSGASGPHNSYVRLKRIYFNSNSGESRVSTTKSRPLIDGKGHRMNLVTLSGNNQVIGCVFRNSVDSLTKNWVAPVAGTGGGLVAESVSIYPGYTGIDRPHGHSFYPQNAGTGEADRFWMIDNIGLWAFHIGFHAYTEGGLLGWIGVQRGVEFHNGNSRAPDTTWRFNQTNFLLGASSAAGPACSSRKVAESPIYDGLLTYGASAQPYDLGWGKGTRDARVVNSYFDGANAGKWQKDCGSPSVVGNTFFGEPVPGSWSEFNKANYPANDWRTARRTTGPPLAFHRPSQHFPGEGYVVVYNYGRTATVPVDLSAAGALAGQRYELWNVQALARDSAQGPFTGTPVATGTCGTPCATIQVSSTLAALGIPVEKPDGWGKDGLQSPPESGPEFNVFLLRHARTGSGPAPTDTPTTAGTAP